MHEATFSTISRPHRQTYQVDDFPFKCMFRSFSFSLFLVLSSTLNAKKKERKVMKRMKRKLYRILERKKRNPMKDVVECENIEEK